MESWQLSCNSLQHLGIRQMIFGMGVIILVTPLCSGLLCVQCETTMVSDTCMTSAPRATPCEGANRTKSIGVSCMVTKIKNMEGEITRYVRGCTAVRVGEGCVEYPNGTMCYETCDSDNCNGVSTSGTCLLNVIYALTTHIFVHACSSRI